MLLSHAFTYIFNNTRLSHRTTNLCAVAAFFWIQRLKNQFWNPTSADASTGQVKQQQEIFILALNLLINSLHQIQLRDCDTRKKKQQPRGKALVSKFFFCGCSCSTYTPGDCIVSCQWDNTQRCWVTKPFNLQCYSFCRPTHHVYFTLTQFHAEKKKNQCFFDALRPTQDVRRGCWPSCR